MVLPYVKGLSQATACVLKRYYRTVLFRPANTIGQQLFKLKEKADPVKMSDAVYKVSCKKYEKCYIEETTRPLYMCDKKNTGQRQRMLPTPEPSPINREKTVTPQSTSELWWSTQSQPTTSQTGIGTG